MTQGDGEIGEYRGIGDLGNEAVRSSGSRCARQRIHRGKISRTGGAGKEGIALRVKGEATLEKEYLRPKIGGKEQRRTCGAYFRDEKAEGAKRESGCLTRR